MVEFEIRRGYFKVWDSGTAFDVYVDDTRDFSGLPSLDEVYNWCKAQGWPQERIIDFMLRCFHRRRVIKGGFLEGMSIVVGVVGSRGSGKSVGATMLAVLDYLLAGVQVWSNMRVQLVVKYRDCRKVFSSIDLNKAALLDLKTLESEFSKGMIYVDEINTELGDALRSTTNKALLWSFLLQQIRKKELDVIWSTQNEDFTTSRTRWQTDFYIVAKDLMFSRGSTPSRDKRGKGSLWRMHDMGGLVTGEIRFGKYNKIDWYKELVVWNRPFWNCYDHKQMQGQEDWALKEKDNAMSLTADADTLDRVVQNHKMVGNMLDLVMQQGVNFILASELWEMLGIDKDNRSETTKIGMILKELGCETFGGTEGKTYGLPDSAQLWANYDKIRNKGGKHGRKQPQRTI